MSIADIKMKTLIKIAIITAILYKIYDLPKNDWDCGKTIVETNNDGTRSRYVPQQSSYLKYMVAWWRKALSTKKLTGVLDEYVLAPMGITFDEQKESKDEENISGIYVHPENPEDRQYQGGSRISDDYTKADGDSRAGNPGTNRPTGRSEDQSGSSTTTTGRSGSSTTTTGRSGSSTTTTGRSGSSTTTTGRSGSSTTTTSRSGR